MSFFSKIFAVFRFHILIFGLAIFLGILTRFGMLTSYVQFDGEQARSGFILQQMWQGSIPTLGAPSSVGGYGILPFYYYWTFLWTIFGSDPVLQVLSNAMPSFATIFLIFILIYKLLKKDFISFGQIWQDFWKIKFSLKLSIASLTALFYSLFFTEILYSQMEWNPNGGTFWLIILVLFLEKFWQNKIKKNEIQFISPTGKFSLVSFNHTKDTEQVLEKSWQNLFWQKSKILGLYLFFGLIVNIILSLHSSFLFVLPPFLAIFGIFWLKEKKSASVLSWSFGSILFWSLSYWLGEFGRNFGNTKNLFKTLLKTSGSHTLAERFDRFWFSLLETGKLSYFPNSNLYLFSNTFLTILLILTILFWRQVESFLLKLLVLFWGIFVFFAANFWGILHTHYLVILWSAPCILTATLLHFFIQNSQFFQNFNSTKKLKENLKCFFLKYFFSKNKAVEGQNKSPNSSHNFTSIESIQSQKNKAFNSQNSGHKKEIFGNCAFLVFFLIFGVILSFQVNVSKTLEYSQSKFGNKRLTSSQDIIATLQFLPPSSTLCASGEKQLSIKYLIEFVVIKNQKTVNLQECLDFLNFKTKLRFGSQNQNLFESGEIFVFWENWQGWEMTENIKPEKLQKLEKIKQIGNIQILKLN